MKRLAIGFVLALISAGATYARPATVDDAAKVRKTYDDCVYNSTAVQIQNHQMHDAGMLAERGFDACKTEERALRLFLKDILQVSPKQVSLMVVQIQLSIKSEMKKIIDNPAGYINSAAPHSRVKDPSCKDVIAALANQWMTPGQVQAAMEIGKNRGCFK